MRVVRVSPARLAAASSPVKAIVAIVSAKIRSFHDGALPRWIVSRTAPGSITSAIPSTISSSCTARSATAISSWRRSARTLTPATFTTATVAITPIATITSSAPLPSGDHSSAM